jgi:uncharacterized protein YcbX
MAQIAELWRYPIKGLSAQPVTSLNLSQADGVAFDRTYALALGTTQFDWRRPEPLDKGKFLILRANETLAELQMSTTPP